MHCIIKVREILVPLAQNLGLVIWFIARSRRRGARQHLYVDGSSPKLEDQELWIQTIACRCAVCWDGLVGQDWFVVLCSKEVWQLPLLRCFHNNRKKYLYSLRSFYKAPSWNSLLRGGPRIAFFPLWRVLKRATQFLSSTVKSVSKIAQGQSVHNMFLWSN